MVQNYFLYAERALARQPVCLWLWEDTLQIEHQDELLASYPCSYDAGEHQLQRLGKPVYTIIAIHVSNHSFCV